MKNSKYFIVILLVLMIILALNLLAPTIGTKLSATLTTITGIFSVFIAMNNKEIQEAELATYKQFYCNIYAVYPKWFNYREKNGYEIPYEKNRLK